MKLKHGEVEVSFDLTARAGGDLWAGRWGALTVGLRSVVGSAERWGSVFWRERSVYTNRAASYQSVFEDLIQTMGALATDVAGAFNGIIDLPGYAETRDNSGN